MHDGKSRDCREEICINVDKVYDWVVKERTFDVSPAGPFTFPNLPAGVDMANAVVTCNVEPAASNPVMIQSRTDRTVFIDGENTRLQQLTIQKNFVLTLYLHLPGEVTYASTSINLAPQFEKVVLCAPEGTDVTVTYTDLDCLVSSAGTPVQDATTPTQVTIPNLTLSVTTCQSIQSTYPVTVEFLAKFCEPRADLATACPPPSRPKQCFTVFPDDNCGC